MDSRALAVLSHCVKQTSWPVIGKRLRRRAVAALLRDGSAAATEALLHALPVWSAHERDWLLEQIAERATPAGREGVCAHFLKHGDNELGATLVAWGYEPRETARQALLFFLTSQWQCYAEIDPDYSLLHTVYETADPQLRGRLMEQARRHGRQEWVQVTVGGFGGKRLGEMSDAEWQAGLQMLGAAQNHDELWRLAQEAPPRWSKRLLDALGDWPLQQVSEPEQEQLTRLLLSAKTCPLEVPKNLGALTRKRWTGGGAEAERVAMNSDGTLLASANWRKGTVNLWRPPAGTPLATLRGWRNRRYLGWIAPLAINTDSTLLAGTCGFETVLWRLPDGVPLANLRGHKAEVRALAFSPDGALLASAGDDGTVHLWHLPDGALLATLTGHLSPVWALSIKPDGTELASAGWDAVRSWRLPDGAPLATLRWKMDNIAALAVGPDGSFILITIERGRDETLRVWRVPDGALLATLPGHRGGVSAVAVNSDGTLLASASDDNTLHLWSSPLPSLAAIPVGAIDTTQQAWLSEQLQSAQASPEERRWLEFTAALIRWRDRYEITFADTPARSPDETDIELVTDTVPHKRTRDDD